MTAEELTQKQEYDMKPIEDLMGNAITRLEGLCQSPVSNNTHIARQCPQGHGKMKKTLFGPWFCINCQRYYE